MSKIKLTPNRLMIILFTDSMKMITKNKRKFKDKINRKKVNKHNKTVKINMKSSMTKTSRDFYRSTTIFCFSNHF